MTFQIRQINPEDKEVWEDLFKGYIEFYKAELSQELIQLTWGTTSRSTFQFLWLGG